MQLRHEPLAGDDSVTSVLYGPFALAANLGAAPADGPLRVIHSGDTVPKNLPKPDPLPKASVGSAAQPDQWVRIESKSDLRFTASAENQPYDLIPMCQIRDQRYALYWQMQNTLPQG